MSFNNYEVIKATDGKEALEIFNSNNIDLIILDVMMPIYDGWIVCKEIRKKSNVPIIMLTAKDSDLDQLFGFDIGADDYVSKPFNIDLLLARVKRLLKTNSISEIESKNLFFKGIKIDEEKHLVNIDDKNIDLSPKEYDLILYFMKNLNKAIHRETLLNVIWGNEYFGDTRTVDTHINRLRNKLGSYAIYLKTVRSFGYKLGEE